MAQRKQICPVCGHDYPDYVPEGLTGLYSLIRLHVISLGHLVETERMISTLARQSEELPKLKKKLDQWKAWQHQLDIALASRAQHQEQIGELSKELGGVRYEKRQGVRKLTIANHNIEELNAEVAELAKERDALARKVKRLTPAKKKKKARKKKKR